MEKKTELLYMKELDQILSFRQYMENTRNLSTAIIGAMALLAFTFPVSSHLVLFLGSLSIFALLIFESRTYRYYDVSLKRFEQIENNIISGNEADRVEKENLRGEPVISFMEAFAVRVYKNYFIIFLALDICWFSKLYLYPSQALNWNEFVSRADFGILPGWVILFVVVPVWGTYIFLIIWLKKKYKGRPIPY